MKDKYIYELDSILDSIWKAHLKGEKSIFCEKFIWKEVKIDLEYFGIYC